MGNIPNRQIGWSTEANLMWQILYQLNKVNKKLCTGPCPTTTTTTTMNIGARTAFSQSLEFPISYVSFDIGCNGDPVQGVYSSQLVNSMEELVDYYNATENFNQYGVYSDGGGDMLKLILTVEAKEELCPDGELSLNVFSD